MIIAALGAGLGGAAMLGVFDDSAGLPSAAAASSDHSAVLDTTFEHFDGRIVRLSAWSGTPMVVKLLGVMVPAVCGRDECRLRTGASPGG